MLQFAQIYDTTNTSPSFKHPPLWIIMAGCDGAYIDLAPSDIDGDTVKCRWGTSVESGGATYDNQLWPSLSLDEDNCIVRYTGSLDKSTEGVKPIGLMIEDFDSDGNLRSSVPVQFLAQVWTPNLNSRAVGVANYPDWFRGPDHDDHRDYVPNQDFHPPVKTSRGRRDDQPAYCDAVPEYTENTPLDGDILDASDGVVDFILEASSQIGEITSFSYEGPLGVKCSDDVIDGRIKCSWELTEGQIEIENHGFCYTATDSFGLTTERRCINIQGRGNIPVLVTSTTTTSTTTTTTTTITTSTTTTSTTSTSTTTTTTTSTTTTTRTITTSSTSAVSSTAITTFMTTTKASTNLTAITNIHELAAITLDGSDGGVSYEDAVNYGCNGQDFDPFAKNSKPVDHADKALLNWKNCVQCALGLKTEQVPTYFYSADQDSCGELAIRSNNKND